MDFYPTRPLRRWGRRGFGGVLGVCPLPVAYSGSWQTGSPHLHFVVNEDQYDRFSVGRCHSLCICMCVRISDDDDDDDDDK